MIILSKNVSSEKKKRGISHYGGMKAFGSALLSGQSTSNRRWDIMFALNLFTTVFKVNCTTLTTIIVI